MTRPALRALLGVVIIPVASACDNVEWGGIDLRLEPPPPVEALAVPASDSTAPDDAPEAELPPLPEGPLVFMGSRSSGRVSLRPIAELSGSGLQPLATDQEHPGFLDHLQSTLLAPGSRYTLYSGSGRVGTLQADTVFTASGFCSPAPIVQGVAELVSDAAGAMRFVALPAEVTEGVDYGRFLRPSHSYEQRVASIELASSAIASNAATWPESVLGTRVDMQAVPLDGDVDGAMAASFLYRDRLEVGSADATSAWAIFVLGVGGPSEYPSAFTWYRNAGRDGKGAARFWEQADVDLDGENEIVLQVFGEGARWAAILDRQGGRWTRAFEESCARTGG